LASNRSYAPDLDPLAVDYELEGPEAHHLAVVRRAKRGEVVELFDGRGSRTRATILDLNKRRVLCQIVERVQVPRPVDERTLAVALPKGDRADWLVEKCTELGVDRLTPLRTERSVVDPGEGKLERFRRTVVEAAKQSGRAWLMTIDPPIDWPQAAAAGRGGWFLDAQPQTPTVDCDESPPEWFAVGPEGGWTDDERAVAQNEQWKSVRFPGDILRIETAATAAAVWWMLRRR
jgi:16S rRNA (uracil1498-N3)-methyltransferase